MRSHPFRGDYGAAIANIRPRYSFDAKTKMVKGMCRVSRFRLQVDFTLTLPHAVERKSFDRRTERSWRSLKSFMRRHELVHRRKYLTCAKAMERKVMKLRTKSCWSLDRKIKDVLRTEKVACERKQRAYDKKELPKLTYHRFFKQARAERDRIQRRIADQFRSKGSNFSFFAD